MTEIVLDHLDGQKAAELRQFLIHKNSGAPSTPATAQFWYDTATDTVGIKTASATFVLGRMDQLSTAAAAWSNGGFKITSLGDAAAAKDAMNRDMVRATTLDLFAAPAGTVSWGSQKLSSLADGTSATDAVNLGQVQAMITGLDFKNAVRVATTAADTGGTYSATGGTSGRGQLTAMPNTLDGVTLAATNRILVKDHATGAARGIYVVTTLGTGANGVWDRATDFDADAEVTAGSLIPVEEGTVGGDSVFMLSTNNPIIIGGSSTPTSLSFIKLGPNSATGTVQKVAGTGTGTASTWQFTHNLGSQDVHGELQLLSTKERVRCRGRADTTNTWTFDFASSIDLTLYRAIILG